MWKIIYMLFYSLSLQPLSDQTQEGEMILQKFSSCGIWVDWLISINHKIKFPPPPKKNKYFTYFFKPKRCAFHLTFPKVNIFQINLWNMYLKKNVECVFLENISPHHHWPDSTNYFLWLKSQLNVYISKLFYSLTQIF